MQIAVLLFDRLTVLDAVGPYEVLSRLPGAEVRFVAREPGRKVAANGPASLFADFALAEVPHPEVVVVPGGPGEEALRGDPAVLAWLAEAHRTSRWTASVCTGSLVLAAAGILKGVRATSHWLALETLRALGAVPVPERVVIEGKIATAAGVSAGIDMALALAARIAGEREAQAIQLSIEYDPRPPFRTGSPSSAPADLVAELRKKSRFR
jgi:putative intracellular protease/amidase